MLVNTGSETFTLPSAFPMRMMSESSSNSSLKGSFDTYTNPQKRAPLAVPEGPTMNSIEDTAAVASARSLHEYHQAVMNLQKEVEIRKRREGELVQYINTLKASQSQSNSMNLADSQYLNADESPSSENVGENVKDAHIKHLQRQVTVLQANLYKAEGWTARVSQVVKERDKALDDLSKLSGEFTTLQMENVELQHMNEELRLKVVDLEQRLRSRSTMVNGEPISQHNQRVVDMQDRLSKQQAEITTLKDSLARLNDENKSLRELSSGSGGYNGNVACSQELEYLHKMVDTLKTTVLEQRGFLLNMRNPSLLSSQPASAPAGHVTGSHLAVSNTLTLGRDHPRSVNQGMGEGDAITFANAQQAVNGHVPQGSAAYLTGLANGRGKDSGSETSPQKPSLGKDLMGEGAAAMLLEKKLASDDLLGEQLDMELKALNFPRAVETSDVTAMRMQDTTQMENKSSFVRGLEGATGVDQKLLMGLYTQSGQMANGDLGSPRSRSHAPQGLPQQETMQRKISQSEVIARRTGGELGPDDQVRSKSETLARSTGSKPAQELYMPRPKFVAQCSDTDSSIRSTAVQSFIPFHSTETRCGPPATTSVGKPLRTGIAYEAGFLPQDQFKHILLEGSTEQSAGLNDPFVNYPRSASSSPMHQHKTQQTRGGFHNGNMQVVNNDMMGGGRITAPPIPAREPRTGGLQTHRNLLQNVPVPSNLGTASKESIVSSSVDPEFTLNRCNSDRVCPVCNQDYSHFSIDDFQTHVYNCFDDDNAPETMKPVVSLDRTCPMCNLKFGGNTSQVDYEKHVHSHFGEERPGDNFEILQP